MKARFCVLLFFLFAATAAHAEVSIETSVNRSRLAVGEELQLDLVIMNADGPVSKPTLLSTEGFTSYSQAHSQEISIINGRASSKSVFSYILIPNSPGRRTVGPFEVAIGEKTFKVAAVEVEVTPSGSGSHTWPQGAFSQAPVSAPPSRALPPAQTGGQDIFVKAWLDKDEAYINEPAMLTYTLYTRLSATYKGFEKEPVTTGFWVEDFPPEKTVKRTEQFLNGSRYVVADVRKTALFPTEAGVFTIDPGTLAAAVEIRDQDSFDSFFSYNIFGRRSTPFSSFAQVVQRRLPTDKVSLLVKTLPEENKPPHFTGAVGDYRIEASVDKNEVEEGSPVTFRVRVAGRGNLNTVEMPALPKLDSFRMYDSSTSTNISKDRLIVEGEKITETVIVPKARGTHTIPALRFSYFNPGSHTYKEIRTLPQTLTVRPGTENVPDETSAGGGFIEPIQKEEVAILGKDIHYIKITDTSSARPQKPWHRRPFYWLLNLLLLAGSLLVAALSRRKELQGLSGLRVRRSHAAARRRLKTAEKLLRQEKKEEFYLELSKALYGYFGDKLGIPVQMVNFEAVEERLEDSQAEAAVLSKIRTLFDALSFGRFSTIGHSADEMRDLYGRADEVITAFEKVKLK